MLSHLWMFLPLDLVTINQYLHIYFHTWNPASIHQWFGICQENLRQIFRLSIATSVKKALVNRSINDSGWIDCSRVKCTVRCFCDKHSCCFTASFDLGVLFALHVLYNEYHHNSLSALIAYGETFGGGVWLQISLNITWFQANQFTEIRL